MLNKFRFGKDKSFAVKMKVPKHIAVEMNMHNENSFSNLVDIINYQVKINLPIMTICLLHGEPNEEYVKELATFISSLVSDTFKSKGVKFSVFGKWYNLPNAIVESIKNLIDSTKDNQDYYVNFCINYSGQEEILDACKLIARKVVAGKLDPDAITIDTIKENVYSSYFIPPELIIVNGKSKSGLLLWDSVDACLYFTHKSAIDFDKSDIIDAISFYQKNK